MHIFDMAREAHAAFRLLQSGRNLGKVVLRVGLQHSGATMGVVDFDHLSVQLARHTDMAVRALDTTALGRAYELLERLCQQYVQEALRTVAGASLPQWHHRLLQKWCETQAPPLQPTNRISWLSSAFFR